MNLDGLTIDDLTMKRRSLRRQLAAQPNLKPLRMAILGGSTTSGLVEVLEILLLAAGFSTVFYESEYGRYYEDAVHDPQALIDFKPELAYVHTSCLNAPTIASGTAQPDFADAVEAELDRFRSMWDSLDQNIGCQVIQNNFELPPYALLGNMEASSYGAQSRFLLAINAGFAAEAGARPKLLLQDVLGMSARLGLTHWFDWDRYFSYKVLLTPEANFAVAKSLTALIRSIYGRACKALVLDLDNTLWGGVIGDDGVDRIQIGRETPVAEAHTAFQQYCLALRSRGVLLAVCSKNDDAVARSGFEHPSSVLKLEHFSSFKANWSPKHENILEIARELNIGVDSLVFIDDNPAERAIVQAQLPDVAVPDVGSEVTSFAAMVDAGRYFEPASLSTEDLQRASLYAANAERVQQQQKFANYGEYLDSLDMSAEIAPFTPVYLERIAQLTNKTNQFNLTTRRYTLAEIEAASKSADSVTLYGRLIDKFGDNGLVSVVLGTRAEDKLRLDLWLMSCRVLKRDMEVAMLDVLVREARQAGVLQLEGSYIPTAKNGMVADHYAKLGFTRMGQTHADGTTIWTLDLSVYSLRNAHIRIL